MRVVRADPEQPPERGSLRDARWLVIPGDAWSELRHLTLFAELDGALVAIDGRGVDLHLEADVQRRAVHLLVVDDVIEAARIQKTAGITKVIAGHQGPIEDLLWCGCCAAKPRGKPGSRWCSNETNQWVRWDP